MRLSVVISNNKSNNYINSNNIENKKINNNIANSNLNNQSKVDIKVGDQVYIHFPFVLEKSGIAEKFYRPWKGPFKILEKLTDVTFKVDFPSNMKSHNIVNVNRMKKL
ncbi:hypothetical protein ACTFIZ_008713 [Dictyostelium cf. discoideum]